MYRYVRNPLLRVPWHVTIDHNLLLFLQHSGCLKWLEQDDMRGVEPCAPSMLLAVVDHLTRRGAPMIQVIPNTPSNKSLYGASSAGLTNWLGHESCSGQSCWHAILTRNWAMKNSLQKREQQFNVIPAFSVQNNVVFESTYMTCHSICWCWCHQLDTYHVTPVLIRKFLGVDSGFCMIVLHRPEHTGNRPMLFASWLDEFSNQVAGLWWNMRFNEISTPFWGLDEIIVAKLTWTYGICDLLPKHTLCFSNGHSFLPGTKVNQALTHCGYVVSPLVRKATSHAE